MIAFLEGTVASKGQAGACIDVGGVGYALGMSQSSVAALPPVGERARVLCRMSVTDSGVFLYGFATDDERGLFDELVQISGIGPKTALAALSCFTPSELASAVASQDVKAISKIPGIGKKSASRIVLELKDKFPQFEGVFEASSAPQAESPTFDAVREALKSMGFTPDEIDFALKDADATLDESAMLQHALKRMV